jgi:hypothetical protein
VEHSIYEIKVKVNSEDTSVSIPNKFVVSKKLNSLIHLQFSQKATPLCFKKKKITTRKDFNEKEETPLFIGMMAKLYELKYNINGKTKK